MSFISATEYIEKLDFEYICTYSFQRGDLEIEFKNQLHKKIEELELQLKTPSFGHFKREKELAKLEQYLGEGHVLVNERKEFHPTSTKISTLHKTDSKAIELVKTLEKETIIEFVTACAPIYRDAIVFYDKNDSPVSCLNVCLMCQKMQAGRNNLIAGNETYAQIYNFFLGLGHPIEQV